MTARKFKMEGTIEIECDPTVPGTPPPTGGAVLLEDRFDGPDGLITNEWAYWSATDPRAVKSPLWEMTSGSMFRKAGQMWSGLPDAKYVATDPLSKTWNHSSVYRADTIKADIQDCAITFKLTNLGYVSTSPDGVQNWDGLELWMRYQSQYSLYTCSVNRRDNTVNFKKKCQGGPSNQGTYWFSPSAPYTPALNVPQMVKVETRNEGGGVAFALTINGKLLLTVTDDGKTWKADPVNASQIQCSPIVVPGRVGMRADNLQFLLDDFVVASL